MFLRFFCALSCFCLFCVCGEVLRKLCHRQEQPEGCSSKYRKTRTFYHGGLIVRWFLLSEGLCKSLVFSIFATVLPGLDPIGFVESDVKSRKTRALRGGRVCVLPVCLLVLMIFSILCWGWCSPSIAKHMQSNNRAELNSTELNCPN